MKKLIALTLLLLPLTVFAQLSSQEEKLRANIEDNMKSRGMTPSVTLKKIKKVANTSDFNIYELKIEDKDNNISNTQYILYNGAYIADDLINPITGASVMKDTLYELSNENIDYSSLSIISGKKGSKNVIIKITDFECPYCQRAYSYIEEKVKGRDDTVVYIAHLPLKIHDKAELYAKIFEAGLLQNENFSEDLFLNKSLNQMTEEKVIDYFAAKTSNPKKFKKDINAEAVRNKIKAGMDIALKVNASATPLIYINGKRVEGFDKYLIDKAFSEMKK